MVPLIFIFRKLSSLIFCFYIIKYLHLHRGNYKKDSFFMNPKKGRKLWRRIHRYNFRHETMCKYAQKYVIKQLCLYLKNSLQLRVATKKVIFLVARPLKPYPPPPSSLVATFWGRNFFRALKKVFFSWWVDPYPPPPPLLELGRGVKKPPPPLKHDEDI